MYVRTCVCTCDEHCKITVSDHFNRMQLILNTIKRQVVEDMVVVHVKCMEEAALPMAAVHRAPAVLPMAAVYRALVALPLVAVHRGLLCKVTD